MHIVHVTHRAWPLVGGSERYVHEIARRQVLDGHQVTVVASVADDFSALWEQRGRRVGTAVPVEQEGVRLRRLSLRYLPLGRLAFPLLRRVTWVMSHIATAAALTLARFSPWVPDLPTVLAEERADLYFAWNITLEGLTAAVARAARQQGVPWLAVPVLHLARSQFYVMPHQMALLRQASAVLVQTASERDFVLGRGFAAEQVHIVSPGIDPAEGRDADGRRFCLRYGVEGPLVVTLGRLCRDKGTLHLLAAARRLWTEGRPLTLALLGPQEADVRRALAALPQRFRPFCVAPGLVSEEDKWDALEAAQVVALPSRTESFGIVFLEGWLKGKPVVGARAGAVPDVIEDGVDGLLVPFGDVPALAGALAALLDDPQRAAQMGCRGQQKALQRYTWDLQYARLRQIVQSVIG
jgi:glycogen(starch) synthase